MISLLLVNFKLCIFEIGTNRMRSFITSLGIFLGVTALWWAERYGHTEVAEFLRSKGAKE